MSALRQALDRLRGARHIEWILLAVALAAAVLLLTDSPDEISDESTALERRMESVLSCIQGAGEVRVLVNSGEAASAFASSDSSVTGVLVVAEGAGNLRVALELQ